ncbi:hypothetical protein HUJ04_007036 [Dendroctonus ponderosae]|nr:hypothetical protein HUJ04_007036 [Dendroctonus ponderosae]
MKPDDRLQICKMFAIQLDESTDISSKAIFYDYDSEIHEDFLCLRELMRTTTDCVFNALNYFLLNPSNIHWDNCVGLSADGAHAMLRKLTGLLARKVTEIIKRDQKRKSGEDYFNGPTFNSLINVYQKSSKVKQNKKFPQSKAHT